MKQIFWILSLIIFILMPSTSWARGGYHGGGNSSYSRSSSHQSSYSRSSYKSSYRPTTSRSTSSAVYVRGYTGKVGTKSP